MDTVYHNGTNGSSPYVDFYPYTPSATAGYAFTGLFGVLTVVHFVTMFPFRAAYFIPLILGGVCKLELPFPSWLAESELIASPSTRRDVWLLRASMVPSVPNRD